MVPHRLCKAVRLRDLSSDDLALMVMLLWSADDELEVVASLGDLMTLCGWEGRDDHTWRRLCRLRDSGLVEYESKPGQRKPYRIRITGGARARSTATSAGTSAGTSAQTPPPRAEVDLRSAEVGIPANQHGSTDQPPHDLRKVEVGTSADETREELRTSGETDDEFEGLLDHVDREGAAKGKDALTGTQRAEALIVWRRSPQVVRSAADQAGTGNNPPGLFMKLLEDGARGGVRSEAAASPDTVGGGDKLARQLGRWIKGEGRFYDWTTCEDEIGRRETSERVELTDLQKQLLFEQHLDEHVPPEAD